MFWFDTRTAQERRQDALEERRVKMAREKDPVPWDPAMPFTPILHIHGDTYNPLSLFKVKPCPPSLNDPNQAWASTKRNFVLSPKGTWGYREMILREGSVLQTFCGNRRGVVVFDAPVKIPMLNKRLADGKTWRFNPWMSFTPMEIFSLRPGTRLACGHTVIAGLGMGHQLSEVCKKRSVKRVTLIEESQELVDWILPKVELHGKKVEVIIGDAYKLVPPMECDVVLIDIFKGYGGNREDWMYGTQFASMNYRKHMWIWGAQSLG